MNFVHLILIYHIKNNSNNKKTNKKNQTNSQRGAGDGKMCLGRKIMKTTRLLHGTDSWLGNLDATLKCLMDGDNNPLWGIYG